MPTLVSDQRLGDVLRMLPAAKYLHEQGRGPVFVKCLEQYKSALDCVTYAQWTDRDKGEVICPQIWPDRYEAFRASGQSWMDFVYSDPRIAGADRQIVLDALPDGPPEGLPEKYNLLAAQGISQGYRYPMHQVMQAGSHYLGPYVFLHMPCNCKFNVPSWSARNIPDLARAIRHADKMLCINSAPAILASSVRRDRETYFLPQKGEWTQDNCDPWPGRIDLDL